MRILKNNFLIFLSLLIGLSAALLPLSSWNIAALADAPAPAAQSPLTASRPQTARSSHTTDVLIYAGDSAAFGDPEAIQAIAEARGMTSKSVTSDELNQMSLDQLSQFGVIAWPGGYAGYMSQSLTQQARDTIRRAVQERGVGFVGFCAGAFIAVTPDTRSGLSVVTAPQPDYYHLENEGTDDAMVNVKFTDGSLHELVWWGGPYLPEWKGGVIARYTDTNQPAIAETWSGNGLVILSGPHPEAPEDWRTKLSLSDLDGLDQNIAGQMLQAAETQQPMQSQ
jgi:glutamine amidotransferase-like uncharacterized protein